MRFASIAAAAAIAVSCGSGAVQAQTPKKIVPAEFPPASYSGRQYVDSKGCVFIRAGVDGAVSWVPRMTRGRDQVCGFQPTLTASAARAPAPAPTSAPAPAPSTPRVVATAPPKPVRTAPAPAPAPAPVSYRAAPAPVAAPAAPSPLPTVVQAPKSTTVRSAAACQGATALSTQYINSTSRYPIRCGPQSAPHVTYAAGSQTYLAPAPSNAVPLAPGSSYTYALGKTYVTHPGHTTGPVYYTAGQVRVAPRHVYESQLAATDGVYVPEGYSLVWEDDRLNTRRAHQTFAGKAQMETRWTKGVPRRLIRKPAGPEVTAQSVPVGHSFTQGISYAQGYNFAVSESAGGTPADRQAGAVSAAVAAHQTVVAHPSQQNRPVAAARSPLEASVSTRSAPASDVSVAPTHRFVQLGAFADAAQAKRTAQQVANSGLPARMGKVTRGGKAFTLVLAGPFGTQSSLDAGLARVRSMGFPAATLKR